MENLKQKKSKTELIYEIISVPAQLFPPAAMIVRLIDSFWPNCNNSRMQNSVEELYNQYKNLDDKIESKVAKFFNSDEGETLFIIALDTMLKTHKKIKLQNIAKALFGVAAEDFSYDRKEHLLKIVSQLEPFELSILNRVSKTSFERKEVSNFDGLFDKIIKTNETSMDEFYFIIKKLESLSLIRMSSILDPFKGVYSPSVLTIGGETNFPMLIVSDLGINLLEYFQNFKEL